MGLGVAVVPVLPGRPLPEPTSVEVMERVGEATSYRLAYALDISGGDLPLLVDDRIGPGAELSVIVPGTAPDCLVRGPVHAQHVHLRHGGAGSDLEVRGADTSIAMDRELRSVVWDGITDTDAVRSIVVDKHGYVPDVHPTPALHGESKHTLVQRDSDLRFVRRLARRNGFLFWVTASPLGVETAHFRRPPVDDASAATLTINLDDPSVRSLDLDWDVERPTSAEGLQLDLNGKTELDGGTGASPLTALGGTGLGAIASETRSIEVSAPVDDAGDLRGRVEGALIEAGWFVTASCSTTAEALGGVVRSHTVVELRGAGSRHSGPYFVTAVRHVIDSTAHRMELELRRNGWRG
jgi:hypothetical protein